MGKNRLNDPSALAANRHARFTARSALPKIKSHMDEHDNIRSRTPMLDTASPYETPEGVDLQLHTAGPIVRAMAWSIDALIRAAVFIPLSILLGMLGEFGTGIMLILYFLLEWFYPVLFEVLSHGATPGKKKMGIMVIKDDGTPVSWPAALLRNLLRAVDMLPFTYGFGLASMLLNKQFKRLGDMAAGTLVVYRQDLKTYSSIPDSTPLAPPLALSLDEQRAIMDFAERGRTLSAPRQEELAGILKNITGTTGKPAIQILHQYANWLQGHA